MPTLPVVRHFLVIRGGGPGVPVDQHRLADLISFVRPRAGDAYPLLLEELCFLAVLTDGRGPH